MVAPRRTIPICNGRVLMRLLKKFWEGRKKQVNRIPKNTDKAAFPKKREIKTNNINIKFRT